MASAPLNWLLKIGGATLKTTAKTLSEAVNTLHDTVTNLSTTVTNLSTTVTNLGTTVTNLGTSKADASTTTTALNNLETNKLNISDLLSLEEIEASTSLTGKGVTAESIKSLNNSLVKIKKLTYTVPLSANASGLGGYIGSTYLSTNTDLPDNIVGYSVEYCYYLANQNFLGAASIYNNEELKVNGAKGGNYVVEILCFYFK